MKRLISLLSVAMLLLAACDDPAPSAPFNGGTVTARIDGAAWSSARANATYAKGILSITSQQPDTFSVARKGIDLHVTDVKGIGTYNLGGLSGNSGHVRMNGLDYYTSLLELARFAGEVSITHLSTESVAGTFRFIAHIDAGRSPEDSVVVSEGRFDLKITR